MPKKATCPSDTYPEYPPRRFHAVARPAYINVKIAMFTIQFAGTRNGKATSAPKTTTAMTSPVGRNRLTSLLAP